MVLRTTRRIVAALATGALLIAGATACTSEEAPEVQLPAQVDAAFSDDAQSQLQAAVDAAVTASAAQGAIVGVWAPWAGSWTTAVGTVDGQDATTDLRFKAGTVTRAMTCDVLYAMADAGTVGLDDDVTSHLSSYAGLEGITLQQLCDSTSGLTNYSDLLLPRFLRATEREWNPRELAAYGMGRDVQFAPGTQYADSDTGYVVLGLALESASNRSLASLYNTYVFDPAGMGQSSLPTQMPTDGVLPGMRSERIDGQITCTEPDDITSVSPTVGWAAGGVVSDLDDLATYSQALALGLRTYDTDARFGEPRSTGGAQPTWFTAGGGAFQAASLVGQYGSVPGYLTAAFSDTETGLTVVAVLNNSRGAAEQVRALALQLAAIGSKLPGAEGQSTPTVAYPWTAESQAEALAASALCS